MGGAAFFPARWRIGEPSPNRTASSIQMFLGDILRAAPKAAYAHPKQVEAQPHHVLLFFFFGGVHLSRRQAALQSNTSAPHPCDLSSPPRTAILLECHPSTNLESYR